MLPVDNLPAALRHFSVSFSSSLISHILMRIICLTLFNTFASSFGQVIALNHTERKEENDMKPNKVKQLMLGAFTAAVLLVSVGATTANAQTVVIRRPVVVYHLWGP